MATTCLSAHALDVASPGRSPPESRLLLSPPLSVCVCGMPQGPFLSVFTYSLVTMTSDPGWCVEMSSLVCTVSDKAGGEESWLPSTAGPAKTGQAAGTEPRERKRGWRAGPSGAGAFSRGLQRNVLPCRKELGENTLTSRLSLQCPRCCHRPGTTRSRGHGSQLLCAPSVVARSTAGKGREAGRGSHPRSAQLPGFSLRTCRLSTPCDSQVLA